jgi:hypothetical protein
MRHSVEEMSSKIVKNSLSEKSAKGAKRPLFCSANLDTGQTKAALVVNFNEYVYVK